MIKKTKRRTTPKTPSERYDALKAIYKDEGVDAALAIANELRFTKWQAWRMIGFWMFPKQMLSQRVLEQRGRENDGLNRCS